MTEPGIPSREHYPVFDAADLALFGWELGTAENGSVVLQCRCTGCGEAHAIELPHGAFLKHSPPGNLHGENVIFHGRMKPAGRTEP